VFLIEQVVNGLVLGGYYLLTALAPTNAATSTVPGLCDVPAGHGCAWRNNAGQDPRRMANDYCPAAGPP
jgi:hypothetical protein